MFFAGANDGKFGSDTPGGGQQDMTGTAGNIGDTQTQQCFFGIGFLEFVCNQVIKRMLDQGLYQFIRGIVRTRGGTLVPLGEDEFY